MTTEEDRKLAEKLKQFEMKDESANTERHLVPFEPADQRKRNLVLDEERFEDTFLKCLICRENYDDDEKVPKMLPCHHTFCLDCLNQMFRVEGEFRQTLTSAFRAMPVAVKISCPTCREGIIASALEIKKLPNDHTVLELVAFIKQIGKAKVAYCSKHQLQPLNFFCEPCMQPVCCDCTVLDHKESTGHEVINVDEAMKKYSPAIDKTLGEIDSEKKSLEEKRHALEKAFDNVEQIQRELAVQIRQTFDRIRDSVDERERELFDLSEREIDRKRTMLRDCMKLVTTRENELKQQSAKLTQTKDHKDLVNMFDFNKAARDCLQSKPDIPVSKSSEDFAVSFQFNSRQENGIRSTIANFGDVTFKFD
ncbi:tripartite motif-containing protein 59-like isoform X2 [Dreissena polymorpha]|uniref:Uncharacterized protein n=2 Tax=Dreissena polymorpha TaxID=45954 RepID=A0A9D4QUD4_DREPO|nr:tripartite motif-containing protein 59-like isoform X2 [Dreissena polymorpha]XP_052278869.1 tripartite motif-containing protein 59-like isoform X2 [Dreissena polymorpha]KAH3843839.1 hypothetical protein DPMN_117370 [Dreissena polymorpha]